MAADEMTQIKLEPKPAPSRFRLGFLRRTDRALERRVAALEATVEAQARQIARLSADAEARISEAPLEERTAQPWAARERSDSDVALSARAKPEFRLGQYNILAGYLGDNRQPWFLYGLPDLSEERRAEILAKFYERGPDGRFCNVGWPNYVRGPDWELLTEDEQRRVSVVHERCFAWEVRREKLIRAIREMDADLFSLVECDHYHDFFEPKLGAHGFDSIWRKRPRRSSDDGCAISRMHYPHAQPSPRRKRRLIAVPSPFRQVRDRLAARSLRAPRVEPP